MDWKLVFGLVAGKVGKWVGLKVVGMERSSVASLVATRVVTKAVRRAGMSALREQS